MKKILDRLSIKNLTTVIIGGQILVYLAIQSGYLSYSQLSLSYNFIITGQIWRIVSFLFIPPTTSPILAILSWYILFLMGNNLENYWGHLHYNIYILLAVVLTNVSALLFNLSIGTNYYLQSSIFLAFAFLNGNFQVRLFFIIPIKIKWIALANWVLYLWVFITGNTGEKILIVASLLNFAIFFSKDIYNKIKYRGKNIRTKIEKKVVENKPLHICAKCSKDDIKYPYLEFRYCSKCNPETCYCEECILDHNHIEV